MTVPCPYPMSVDELDAELVRCGFITEQERISRGYQRILETQLKRRGLTPRPHPEVQP